MPAPAFCVHLSFPRAVSACRTSPNFWSCSSQHRGETALAYVALRKTFPLPSEAQLTNSYLISCSFALVFVFLQVPPGFLYHTKYCCRINSPVFNGGTFVGGQLCKMLLTEMGYTFPLRLLSLSQMVAFHASSCPSSAFINANDSALGCV